MQEKHHWEDKLCGFVIATLMNVLAIVVINLFSEDYQLHVF